MNSGTAGGLAYLLNQCRDEDIETFYTEFLTALSRVTPEFEQAEKNIEFWVKTVEAIQSVYLEKVGTTLKELFVPGAPAFFLTATRYAEQRLLKLLRSNVPDEVISLLAAQATAGKFSADKRLRQEPAATFAQEDLQKRPIAIVTHHFYNGKNGYKARNVRHPETQALLERALVMVDERPEEVEVYETTLKDAERVREVVEAKRPDLRPQLERLSLFLMRDNLIAQNNTITRAAEDFGPQFVANQLEWFATPEADIVVRDHSQHVPGLGSLFGLAKAMTQGCAFTSQSGSVVYYVGWKPKLTIRHGMVLLDATADIDGITPLCPWREHIAVPRADYRNLEIIHVPQHTKRRTSEYLKTAANQRAYVKWMIETIKLYMQPGERGLVVCKKVLFDQERIPAWDDADPRFKDPDSFQKRYEWDIEGRQLCAIHYGIGIGRNDWQEADMVFMFDEFYLPKRTVIANVQGYGRHNALQGPLASMTTLNSKSEAVKIFADGHRLRWTKQLALRGNGRRYDANGLCGRQRLVISNDLKSFASNVGRLFPGATPQYVGKSKRLCSYRLRRELAHLINDVPQRRVIGIRVTGIVFVLGDKPPVPLSGERHGVFEV